MDVLREYAGWVDSSQSNLRRQWMFYGFAFRGSLTIRQVYWEISVLAVESTRVQRWYRPGLLLIGDAAHVMSPIGGVGINYAVQDAVVAANVLSAPLKKGVVAVEDLRAVQRQREWPVKVIQW